MQCKTCRFYDEADNYAGWCKRSAPRAFLVSTNMAEEEIDKRGWWPGVEADDWCGEYAWDQQSKSLNEKINEETDPSLVPKHWNEFYD